MRRRWRAVPLPRFRGLRREGLRALPARGSIFAKEKSGVMIHAKPAFMQGPPLCKTRVLHEFQGSLFDQTVAALAFDRDAACLEEHRRGEGGGAREGNVIDVWGEGGEHGFNPAKIHEAAQSLGLGDFEHQVVGVVFSERVVENIRRDSSLAARFAAALVASFNQARDDGGGAESALHHGVAGQPFAEALAQFAGVQQGGGVGDRVEAPDQGGVIGGDET